MQVLRSAFRLVRQYARPFVLLNFAYFGIVCGGMAYGAWESESRDNYQRQVRQQARETLPLVTKAYDGGHVAQAIGMTFTINLLAGSLLVITLPSLIVPFLGLPVAAVRAFAWGMIFSPTFTEFSGAVFAYGLLVGLLLLLEGQGYVLAMLGAYIQGSCFLRPQTAGVATHWQGYKIGATRTLQLYALVAAVLAVAAVYEAVMVIYLMPLVR